MIMLILGMLVPVIAEDGVLFSIKDTKKPGAWTAEGKVKIDIQEKEGVKIVIPAGKEETIVTLEVKKFAKCEWLLYNILKLEIENPDKNSLIIKFRLERRALDDWSLQDENPRFDKDLTVKPGKNTFDIDVTGASRDPGWKVYVEKINFTFVNKEKAVREIYIRNISLGQEE